MLSHDTWPFPKGRSHLARSKLCPRRGLYQWPILFWAE